VSVFGPDVLAGKRILITGGGIGLGRIVAGYLVQHGATVHLWRRQQVLEEAAEEVSGDRGPGVAHVQTVTVREAEQVDAAVQAIWDEQGPLTGLGADRGSSLPQPWPWQRYTQ
jgi:NAD(P)-dependent dehydrogenase (short-subunit alcohol dehydrogenase family)